MDDDDAVVAEAVAINIYNSTTKITIQKEGEMRENFEEKIRKERVGKI